MRKILVYILFYLTAAAAWGQSATVTIDHYTEYPGPVQIPVEVTGFTNIGSISIYFQYDPAVLTFTGYQGTALSGMEANAFVENGITQVGITWSATGTNGSNVPNGNLITVLFNYMSGSGDFTFLDYKCEITDIALNNISTLYIDGGISPKGNAYLDIPDVTNQTPNSTVNIPVNANFSEINGGVSSFTLIIDFDPEVLSFQNVSSVNPLLAGGVNVDILGSSRISLTWLNTGSSGIQGSGEFKLLDVTMSYSVGSSALIFYETLCSVGDNNGLDVNAIYSGGTISQNPATMATVIAGQITWPTSSGVVDVPVTVNFSGITGGVSSFNFIIDFDPEVLQFQQVVSPALSPVVTEMISASRLSVSWLNPGSTGSVLNGKLLDLRFNFTGGSSNIDFMEASCEMGDNNALDVNAAYTDGWVHQDPQTIIQVMAGSITANAGTTVEVPVTVRNFENIGSFDFYVLFDPVVLTLTGVVNPNPGINPVYFEYNLIGNNKIGINWYTSTAVTLDDDAKLFDLQFSFSGGQSNLTFDLASCEVANISSVTQYVQYTNGLVAEDMPNIINVKVSDVLAQPGSVDVPVTANGFSNIGAFDFTINFDIQKLTFTGISNAVAALDNIGELIYNHVGDQIFIAWNLDQSEDQGFTATNGETLFNLSFAYAGGESDILFETADCSVSDFDLELLDVSYLPGSVKSGIDVTLTLFLEGLYNGTGLNKTKDWVSGATRDKFPGTVVDTLTVELHASGSYGTPVYTIKGVELNQNGTVVFSIPGEYSASYYITVKHRNHLATVSQLKSFASTAVTYDFTSAATQAYGSNMKALSGGKYGVYAGDLNGDGFVDINDSGPTIISVRSGSVGYLLTDINGDGYVDINDSGPVIINVRKGISAQTP